MPKRRLICSPHIGDVSDIKLIRTDTTLDLSQKAEKRCPSTASDGRLHCGYSSLHLGSCMSFCITMRPCVQPRPLEKSRLFNGLNRLCSKLSVLNQSTVATALSNAVGQSRRGSSHFHKFAGLYRTAKPTKNSLNSWVFLSTEVFSKRRKAYTLCRETRVNTALCSHGPPVILVGLVSWTTVAFLPRCKVRYELRLAGSRPRPLVIGFFQHGLKGGQAVARNTAYLRSSASGS